MTALINRTMACVALSASALWPAQISRAAEGEGGEKVYQKALASTVWIVVPVGQNRYMSGTGSLVDLQKKLILTNFHVVADKDEALVFFPIIQKDKGKTRVVPERDAYTKGGKAIKGKIVARESKKDLALIQLEAVPEGAKAMPRAREGPDPGQRLHSIGNPGASDALWVYTSGTCRQVYHKKFVAGSKRAGDNGFEVDARIVETQSPVNSGDSGGPVVNDKGELVAVTQGHLEDSQARLVSIFIDVSEVNDLLAKKGVKVPPVAAVTSKPKEVETASQPMSEKPAEDSAEKDATRKLKLARGFLEDKKWDNAKTRLQEIIDKFPKTKSAEEAKSLLEKIK